jgi:titin
MYSEQLAGVDPVLTPVAPSELVVNFVPGGSANLSWQDNSSNETGFVVERSYDGTTFDFLANLAPNSNAYADAVPAGTTYYRVKAVNGFGSSDYSNIAAAGGGKPTPPTGVRVLAAH